METAVNRIRATLLVLILGSVVPFLSAAAPQFFIQGSTSWERARLTRMEQSLNFTKEPMTSTWQVIIDPGDEFRANVQFMLEHHEIDHYTDSAYTSLPSRQTHVNEDYLVVDDSRVRQTLAHEAGHLICECHDEEKANEIAYQLQFYTQPRQ
jgi:hypothetical protein